jgi:UDP-N-acetylglucosamine acyltransferase
MNYEGLRRRGFSAERLAVVKSMHKALYRDNLTLDLARQAIADLGEKDLEALSDIEMMLSFLAKTSPQRGIVR